MYLLLGTLRRHVGPSIAVIHLLQLAPSEELQYASLHFMPNTNPKLSLDLVLRILQHVVMDTPVNKR